LRARGDTNLFEASNSLRAEWEFFGRGGLLHAVGEALSRGNNIYLTGTRKSGKTSFLNLLRVRLSDRPCISIDLEGLGGEGDWVTPFFTEVLSHFDRWALDRFGEQWAQLLSRTDDTPQWPGSPASMAAWQAQPVPHVVRNRRDFVQAMRERCMWARKLGLQDRILLFLDELDRITPRPGHPEEVRQFLDVAAGIRALAPGPEAFLSVVVAALRPEANRRNDLDGLGTNPFFEFFRETPLPNLEPGEVAEMARSLARRMGAREVEDTFCARLHDLSGGHARLTRMMAAAAWRERQDSQCLRAADLEHGIDAMAERDYPNRFFEENFWSPLSSIERAVLQVAAQGGPVLRPPEHASITKTTWATALASLRDQSLLQHNRIPAQAFRDWILDCKLVAIDKEESW
jgi:hypothetical protein